DGFCSASDVWQSRVSVETARFDLPEQRIDNLSRGSAILAVPPQPTQLVSLNFEQAGFNRCGAAQSPQQTGQSQYQFPLHSGLSIVIRNDGRFECFIIFSVPQRSDHRLRGKTVTNRIAAGSQLTLLRSRTGAFTGVSAVGIDLLEGSH